MVSLLLAAHHVLFHRFAAMIYLLWFLLLSGIMPVAEQLRPAVGIVQTWGSQQTPAHRQGRVASIRDDNYAEVAFSLEKQQANVVALTLENARQQGMLWVLAAGLGLLAMLLLLSYRQLRTLYQTNSQLCIANQALTEHNQHIQEQVGRLHLLLQELHHRIRNNLAVVSSLLKLQAHDLPDVAAARAVREGQQRVEAMGLIHQRLYLTDDAATLEMRPYLTTLVESLLVAYGYHADRFDLLLELELPTLGVDRAAPLGLIINELVTNALKHAYAHVKRPLLRISLKAAPGSSSGILLEVEDNGSGKQLTDRQPSVTSFGKRLILALSAQLGGQVTTSNSSGTFFRLLVPATAAIPAPCAPA